jgi:predicted component of type VI protein secretion system
VPAFLIPQSEGLSIVPLDKPIVLVGRQSDCDLVITHSRKVSRKHCCIAQVDNHWMVRDLGSTNGVTVNGQRITGITRLRLGDQLLIGDVPFELQNKPQSGAVAVPPAAPPANAAAQLGRSQPLPPVARNAATVPNAPADAAPPAREKKRAQTVPDSGPLVPDAALPMPLLDDGPAVDPAERVTPVQPTRLPNRANQEEPAPEVSAEFPVALPDFDDEVFRLADDT